jgi:hypothetical protein
MKTVFIMDSIKNKEFYQEKDNKRKKNQLKKFLKILKIWLQKQYFHSTIPIKDNLIMHSNNQYPKQINDDL